MSYFRTAGQESPPLRRWPLTGRTRRHLQSSVWARVCLAMKLSKQGKSFFPKETATESAAGLYQEGSGGCGSKENLLLSSKLILSQQLMALMGSIRATPSFPSQTPNLSIVQIPELWPKPCGVCIALVVEQGDHVSVDFACGSLQCLQNSLVPFTAIVDGSYFVGAKPQLKKKISHYPTTGKNRKNQQPRPKRKLMGQ